MVAAHGQTTALPHCSLGVQNVVSGSAAHINHESAKVLLLLCKHDLRGSEPAKHNVLYLQRQFLHTSNGVLDPRAHTMDDVKIGFQFLAEHTDRVQHALLAIHLVMLNDGMQESVLRGNAYLARVNFYVLHILLIDFIAVLREHNASAIAKTLQV